MYTVKRSPYNPILVPDPTRAWESVAFNPCAVVYKKQTHLIYRAMGLPDKMLNPPTAISVIGTATSRDGHRYEDHTMFFGPSEDFDRYGCEDPRTTHFEGKFYTFYTALGGIPFSAGNIKIACAISDDLTQIESKHLVTPFNAKAMALFPERINGLATVILTAHQDEPPQKIAIAQAVHVDDFFKPEFWHEWDKDIQKHSIQIIRNDQDFAEVGAPPIKTEHGWLLVYSYMKDYFKGDARVFGIEALLLDLNDPTQVVARTQGPFLVPEQPYEGYGIVKQVTFPSGALLHGDRLDVYYGGADTVGAMASIHLPHLFAAMGIESSPLMTRAKSNPILTAVPEHPWEAKLAFNPAAIDAGGSVHILYRAMGADNTSTMGYARSEDGIHIDERLDAPVYVPREDFEQKRGSPNGNSGCEDGRISQIGDRLYLCYTAYDGINHTRVAVSSISVDDFVAKRFDQWSKPQLITPNYLDEKDVCLFPEAIRGKYVLLHRVSPYICIIHFDTLDFSKEEINRCVELMGPRPGTWESEKVGIAGPPIKTEKGWLLIYHAVSGDKHYSLGAALLDLDDPTVVLARTVDPILSPDEPYEKIGEINNVVFSNGAVVRGDTLFVYYGGADAVVGVATGSISRLLDILAPSSLA